MIRILELFSSLFNLTAGLHQPMVATTDLLQQIKHVCMYVCVYVCMECEIAQVVEHQTADPWVAGSSLTSGEKCKSC